MEKEILTDTINQNQIREELKFLVEYFAKKGFKNCQILFGYPWGLKYYSGNQWIYEEIKLQNLVPKITELEKNDLGEVGLDDIFIRINDLEFRFCHDSDIHLFFNDVTQDVEYYFSHWTDLGYNPSVWKREKENSPGKKITLSSV